MSCQPLEAELLLCCSRTRVDAERAERIKALVHRGVDWRYLIDLAYTHQVLPLLYRSLQTVCPDHVPLVLKRHYSANAARSLLLTEELIKLISLLDARGIRAVPFKGPTLAAHAYGNITLRQFSDLDILVPDREVNEAKEILISEGYRQIANPAACGHDDYSKAPSVYNFVLKRSDGKVAVELHWGLAEKYLSMPIEIGGLWERLEYRSLSGQPMPGFPAKDLLLFLCAHGSKHCWERLEWICDVAELIETHQDMDYAGLVDEAKRMGGERMVGLGFYLAHELLGAALPEQVLRKIRSDKAVRKLALAVRKKLLSGDAGRAGIFGRPVTEEGIIPEAAYFQLRVRERYGEKLRYCAHIARLLLMPTIKDRQLMRMPRGLSFLYYFVRPIRLFNVYGLGILKNRSNHPQ